MQFATVRVELQEITHQICNKSVTSRKHVATETPTLTGISWLIPTSFMLGSENRYVNGWNNHYQSPGETTESIQCITCNEDSDQASKPTSAAIDKHLQDAQLPLQRLCDELCQFIRCCDFSGKNTCIQQQEHHNENYHSLLGIWLHGKYIHIHLSCDCQFILLIVKLCCLEECMAILIRQVITVITVNCNTSYTQTHKVVVHNQ